MEETKTQDPEILKGLFENGFMGIEIDEEYGGTGSNFMTTILAVEELSKVDSNISILVDIQNSLVNPLIKRLGTDEQKKKYLPKLATESVIKHVFMTYLNSYCSFSGIKLCIIGTIIWI